MFWLEYKTIHHEQIESKIKAPKNLKDLFIFNNTQKNKVGKKKKKPCIKLILIFKTKIDNKIF